MGEKNFQAIPFIIIFVIISIADSHAEIYKHVDKEGRITYSNKVIRGGNKLQTGPSSPRANRNKKEVNKDFPRVSENIQSERDSKRRQILENELATEKKLLIDAKRSLVNEKRNGETSESNIINSQPGITQYKKEIKNRKIVHKRNIMALRKELAN